MHLTARVLPERCTDEAVREQQGAQLRSSLGLCPQPGRSDIGSLGAAPPSSASAASLSLVCRLILKGKNKRRREISNSA